MSWFPSVRWRYTFCTAGPGRIYIQANAGFLLSTVSTTPAGDIERDRNQVADFQKLYVVAFLNHLSGDLMAENQTGGSGCASAHHMLIASADIG